MIVRPRFSDGEADRDEVEEGRVGCLYALASEIVARMKDELEPAGARVFRADQRSVGPTVRIGRDVGDERALAFRRELVELDTDPFGRPAAGDVEDMGGEAGQVLLRRRRRTPVTLSRRRDASHRAVRPCKVHMAAAPSSEIVICAGA